MSRIGKLPITLPAGVSVNVGGGVVTVKGPKGELCEKISTELNIKNESGVITVERSNDERETRAMHGLSRALIANMVTGVTSGFEKTLEIVGVGYRAQKNGSKLILSMGYSHPVEVEEGNGITFDVPTPTSIVVKGASKQKVGQVASNIRSVRPPEPYKGKGIRYKDEHVRRKVGKTGMK